MQRQTFTPGNYNHSGTSARPRTSERFVNVEREAYAYLLNYLYQRFGAVQRTRNSFLNPAGERVALLLDADSLMVLGKGIFQSERISIAQVVKALRAKGRPRIFRTNLIYCAECQSFMSSRIPLTEHEQNGERHELKQVLTFAYPTYVRERKPLTASKSWISPDVLAKAFAVHAGNLAAPLLAKFRCDAFSAGIRLTVQELVDYSTKQGMVVSEAELVSTFLKGMDHERYVANIDAREAAEIEAYTRMSRRHPLLSSSGPLFCTMRRSLSEPRPGESGTAGRGSEHEFGWKEGTMLEWKVTVNGTVLSREQKLAAMMKLGLLDEEAFRMAVDSNENPQRLNATHDFDAANNAYDEEEQMRQRYLRTTKKGWKAKRITEKKERSLRDYKGPVSVRLAEVVPNPQQLEPPTPSGDPHDDDQHPKLPPPAPEVGRSPDRPEQRRRDIRPPHEPRPAPKTAEQLEEEKRKFLELFHILPEEIVYEKGDAIKAEKVVAADSDYGARRLQVFNSVFYPQRTPLPGEFHTRDMEFAMGLAEEMKGNVVVTDDVKRGFSSLSVSIENSYTVRVATRDGDRDEDRGDMRGT